MLPSRSISTTKKKKKKHDISEFAIQQSNRNFDLPFLVSLEMHEILLRRISRLRDLLCYRAVSWVSGRECPMPIDLCNYVLVYRIRLGSAGSIEAKEFRHLWRPGEILVESERKIQFYTRYFDWGFVKSWSNI